MKKSDGPLLNKPTIIGFVFFLIPFFYFILWAIISGRNDSQANSVASFQRFLPPSLKDPVKSTGLFIVFGLVSIALITKNRVQQSEIMTNVTTAILVVAIIMTFFLSFSLL